MPNPKLGSWLDSLLKVGTTIFGATQSGGNNPRIDTYGQIDSIVLQLRDLDVAFAAMSASQRLQAANGALQAGQQLKAALDTIPTGNDGQANAYKQSAKSGADSVINHIQQMIVEAQNGQTTPVNNTPSFPSNPNLPSDIKAPNTQPVTLQDGSIVYVPITQQHQMPNQLINGIDNQTLAIGAGVLVVAVLLLEK